MAARSGAAAAANDDRFESAADWARLDEVRRLAARWQRWVGPGAGWLPRAFSWATIQERTLPAGTFGAVVGLRRSQRWQIYLNARLPLAARTATLGHEFAHTFQPDGLGVAWCAPRAGLPVVEQEAHAIGALLVAPLAVVADLKLGDYAAQRERATATSLPSSYLEIRRALAVFLDELAGDRADASAYLNAGMIHHARWQVGVMELLQAGEDPRVFSD